MPLQREVMAELLADLLLDHDLIDAQVELVLLMAGVHWRVLDGMKTNQFEQAKPALADLPWLLQAQESYTALTSFGTAEGSVMGSSVTVALGVKRPHLKAWIDVIDQADLVLRRVDWRHFSPSRLAGAHPSLVGKRGFAEVRALQLGTCYVGILQLGMNEIDVC